MLVPDTPGQAPDLLRVEVIDLDREPVTSSRNKSGTHQLLPTANPGGAPPAGGRVVNTTASDDF